MTAKLTPEEHQFPDIKSGFIQAFCMHGLPVLCKTCWDARATAITELARYKSALETISLLDPEFASAEGFNEWGEADCFRQAQKIAKTALDTK